MKNIAVIGAGTMGNGIAHTAAAAGLSVTLIDVEKPILERAMSTISANLQRGVDKGRLSVDEKNAVIGTIRTSTEMDAIASADMVIEAIIENLGAKSNLFRSSTAWHATNASSLRTRPRSPSRKSRYRPNARTKSSACIS